MIFRNKVHFLVSTLAIIAALSAAIGQDDETGRERAFSFSMKDRPLLPALLKFTSDNQLPLGIILQPGDSLCSTTKSLDMKEVQARQIIDGILQGSDYVATNNNGVWTIMPRTVPPGSSYLLNIRMEQFGTMKTTVQGLGIILAGYIRAHLRPNEGYAGHILASTRAENVEPFTLRNVTVEEAANHIVTLAGKGFWILYPVPDNPRETAARHLYIFGYADDAGVIARLSCNTPDSTANDKR